MGDSSKRRWFFMSVLVLPFCTPVTEQSGMGKSTSCVLQKYNAVFSDGFIPQCTPNGDYERVQCYEDECWCVRKESGREIPHTRVNAISLTDDMCDYEALGATKVDLLKPVTRKTWKDILHSTLADDALDRRPSYFFNESATISVNAKEYLPPALWPDFAVLATVRPAAVRGGFLFAVVDTATESTVQLGLSIGEGPTLSEQAITLWYSERPDLGSRKTAEFVVPSMVGRWSRLGIAVHGADMRLFIFCQPYEKVEYTRSLRQLPFIKESMLLVGHGGEIFHERFKGDIQELVLVDDPSMAAKHCSLDKDHSEKQLPPETEYGSGLAEDDNTVGDDEDGNGLFPGARAEQGSSLHVEQTIAPGLVTGGVLVVPEEDLLPVIESEDMLGTAVVAVDEVNNETVGEAMAGTEPRVVEERVITIKGEKGDAGYTGQPGPEGRPGSDGTPGVQGAVGPAGHKGQKGEHGETGFGETGLPGLPGISIPGIQGLHGAKGEKGDSITGPPGPSGLQGLPGPPGSPASILDWLESLEGLAKEADEFTLTPGLQSRLERLRGPKGEPGESITVVGSPGKDGLDGAPGIPGFPGASGAHGIAGPPGHHGSKGEQGDPGMHGAEGPQGQTGARGEKGDTGDTGLPGREGPPGPPGYIDPDSLNAGRIPGLQGQVGPDGLPGPEGPMGPRGHKGDAGDKGERGDIGITGEKGDRGHEGSAGTQGIKGDQGPPGEAGTPGVPGQQGSAGHKGDRGADGVGLPGPPGPPGSPSSSSMSSRYMSSIFSSGDNDDSGNGLGPAGLKGDKGDAGRDGRPGQTGLMGMDGKEGEKGDRGEPGLSAKDLDIAKGDKGDKGGIGSPGGCKTCLGFKGDSGKRGAAGEKGSKGDVGVKGDIGLPGFPGRHGTAGEKGEKGEGMAGEKGEDGRPGPPGPPLLNEELQALKLIAGQPGLPGSPGTDGRPGPRGKDGLPGLGGPKGEKGNDGEKGEPGILLLRDGQELIPGPDGPPGPPGPPGVTLRGPAGYPGSTGPRGLPGAPGETGQPGSPGIPGRDPVNSGIGVAQFANQAQMISSATKWPVGTIAFVADSQKVYVRITLGWQMFSMGLVISIPTDDNDSWNAIPDSSVVSSSSDQAGRRDPPQHASDEDGQHSAIEESVATLVASASSATDGAQTETGKLSIRIKEVSPPIEPTHAPAEILAQTMPPPIPERPSRGLRIAALDTPLAGNVQGIAGADHLCYRQSRRAGLRGTFRAVLATRLQNMASLVHPRDRDIPVTNIRGEKMLESWKSVLDGQCVIGRDAPLYSFEGRNVMEDSRWPNKFAWHGAETTGVASPGSYCEAWSSNVPESRGMASAIARDPFLRQLKYSCNNLFAVLCIETTTGGLRR